MVLYKVSTDHGRSSNRPISGSVFYTLKEARERKKRKTKEEHIQYHIYKLIPTDYSKHMPASQQVYYYKKVE